MVGPLHLGLLLDIYSNQEFHDLHDQVTLVKQVVILCRKAHNSRISKMVHEVTPAAEIAMHQFRIQCRRKHGLDSFGKASLWVNCYEDAPKEPRIKDIQ